MLELKKNNKRGRDNIERLSPPPVTIIWLCLLAIVLLESAAYGDGKAEVFVQMGHSSPVLSVSITPDGRYALSGSEDGTTRLWDVAAGNELIRIVSFDDGEWVAITPEGYYNASANGDKHLNVRIGNNVYGIDRYRSTYYKPRVVEAALKPGNTR